jgi:hypothetical protein
MFSENESSVINNNEAINETINDAIIQTINETINETIFEQYEKYNTNNKLKSYIISKLKEIGNKTSEELLNNIKKNILPYLMEKRELKVRYNTNEYNVEFINSKENNLEDTKDDISECSTIDKNQIIENKDNDLYNIINEEEEKNFYENQTYLVESDDSDEESLIQNAIQISKKKSNLDSKLKFKKSDLENLSVQELRDIMREKKITLTKNGVYYTKKEIIKILIKL